MTSSKKSLMLQIVVKLISEFNLGMKNERLEQWNKEYNARPETKEFHEKYEAVKHNFEDTEENRQRQEKYQAHLQDVERRKEKDKEEIEKLRQHLGATNPKLTDAEALQHATVQYLGHKASPTFYPMEGFGTPQSNESEVAGPRPMTESEATSHRAKNRAEFMNTHPENPEARARAEENIKAQDRARLKHLFELRQDFARNMKSPEEVAQFEAIRLAQEREAKKKKADGLMSWWKSLGF